MMFMTFHSPAHRRRFLAGGFAILMALGLIATWVLG